MKKKLVVNVGLRFGEQELTSHSLLFPSKTYPTIKALLDEIVASVNEETGSHYKVVTDKEKIIEEIMP